MRNLKKISELEIEKELIADVDNVDAWKSAIKVPPSTSPRPEWYGRNNVVVLDADVADVFTDS